MITDLKNFLSSRILDMNSLLLKAGYPNLDKKKLMAGNGWKELSQDLQAPLYKREAYQQAMNFIEHTPNYMDAAGATKQQQLEYLARNFMDRYETWLKENYAKYDVKGIIDAVKSRTDERHIPPDSTVFDSLTVILIHRYAYSRLEPTTEPQDSGPDEPEAA